MTEQDNRKVRPQRLKEPNNPAIGQLADYLASFENPVPGQIVRASFVAQHDPGIWEMHLEYLSEIIPIPRPPQGAAEVHPPVDPPGRRP